MPPPTTVELDRPLPLRGNNLATSHLFRGETDCQLSSCRVTTGTMLLSSYVLHFGDCNPCDNVKPNQLNLLQRHC